jgi:hypothetical protein
MSDLNGRTDGHGTKAVRRETRPHSTDTDCRLTPRCDGGASSVRAYALALGEAGRWSAAAARWGLRVLRETVFVSVKLRGANPKSAPKVNAVNAGRSLSAK